MLAWLLDAGMAIAPVTGYVMQYRLILQTKSVGAFSIDICLVLLFANILRLNFYIFRQYELALFFQSLFMITAQVLLVKICIQFQRIDEKQASEVGLQGEKEADEDEENFWRWSKFDIYVKHIVGFIIGTLVISVIIRLLDLPLYGDLVGMVALLSESLLILPQIIQIFKQQRVGGISYSLIFLNLFGDIVKTFYFFLKDQPFQFKLCGVIQLILDSFVILQIGYFKRKEGLTEIEEQNGQPQDQQLKNRAEMDINIIDKELQGSMSQTARLQQVLQSVDRSDKDTDDK